MKITQQQGLNKGEKLFAFYLLLLGFFLYNAEKVKGDANGTNDASRRAFYKSLADALTFPFCCEAESKKKNDEIPSKDGREENKTKV